MALTKHSKSESTETTGGPEEDAAADASEVDKGVEDERRGWEEDPEDSSESSETRSDERVEDAESSCDEGVEEAELEGRVDEGVGASSLHLDGNGGHSRGSRWEGREVEESSC